MPTVDDQDGALISRLAACGCPVPAGAKRLADVPRESVLSIVQKCVDSIADREDTPVPSDRGDRVLAASKIAAACKDLGYSGELGYDLFIYPNEPDLRSVLSFLAGKISDGERRGSSETADSFPSLMRKVALKLKEVSDEPWLPPYCTSRCYGVDKNGVWSKNCCGRAEPFVSEPFVVAKDCKNITAAFDGYWKNLFPTSETVEPEESFDRLLRADIILNKLKSKDDTMNGIKKNYKKDCSVHEIPKIKELNIQSLDFSIFHDKNEKNNIIQSFLTNEDSSEQIMMLQEKLLNSITYLKKNINETNEKISQVEPVIDEEQQQSTELIQLENKIKLKTSKLKKLQKNKVYFSMLSDGERIIFTNDVNETIDHLIKLKADMTNIISNINTTQKEINRINGILDRSFAVADELIFKDAKKDEFARKTYKLIANVHTECNELCNMVEEIGVYARDTVAIEKNIETAQQKNTKENLKRAIEDLQNLSIKQKFPS